jgi:hypothetical protein
MQYCMVVCYSQNALLWFGLWVISKHDELPWFWTWATSEYNEWPWFGTRTTSTHDEVTWRWAWVASQHMNYTLVPKESHTKTNTNFKSASTLTYMFACLRRVWIACV